MLCLLWGWCKPVWICSFYVFAKREGPCGRTSLKFGTLCFSAVFCGSSKPLDHPQNSSHGICYWCITAPWVTERIPLFSTTVHLLSDSPAWYMLCLVFNYLLIIKAVMELCIRSVWINKNNQKLWRSWQAESSHSSDVNFNFSEMFLSFSWQQNQKKGFKYLWFIPSFWWSCIHSQCFMRVSVSANQSLYWSSP